jgi:diaminobutyrate-2-oxoglutarate transaminase
MAGVKNTMTTPSMNAHDWLDDRFQDFSDHQDEFGQRLHQAGLHFEGKPYPVSLRPMLITAEQAAKVSGVAETFHPLLERAADIYCGSQAARDLFPAYRVVESLIRELPRFRPLVQICRLDGVVDVNGDFQIFETGADGPGGVVQNGIAGRLWLEIANELKLSAGLDIDAQPLVDQPDLLTRQLLSAHEGQFGCRPEGAAVVNLNGRWTNEVDWIAEGLQAAGVAAQVCDAASFRVERGKLVTPDGLAVTLTYNKPEQNELVNDRGARRYLESAARQEIAFVNPPLAYTVLGDKAILAVLSDPRFSSDFTSTELEFIRRHVPWIRMLAPTTTTDPDGAQVDLPEFVLRNQERLVLKPINLTRGENILVGPAVSPSDWRDAVQRAVRTDSYVVQRYVPLPPVDVPAADGRRVEMVHGLDLYVFGGRTVGFQCRASLDAVVNIGHRGMLLPPVVVK